MTWSGTKKKWFYTSYCTDVGLWEENLNLLPSDDPLVCCFFLYNANVGKELPVWETWVLSLGWEDPLEKGTAYPIQYSGLGNSMDSVVRSPWGRKESPTTDFHLLIH